MRLDVNNLDSFYSNLGLGKIVKDVISSLLLEYCKNTKDKNIVGYGFLAPVAETFRRNAERLTLLMPGSQGVIYWPDNESNVSVLCEENLWPLPSGKTDYIISLHGLEFSENITALLNECWRVLAPGGKALFIVPNRLGLWCRTEVTPFGSGRPYTVSQLESQLLKHSFSICKTRSALFSMPSDAKFSLKSSKFLEGLGKKVFPIQAGGIILVEVSKQTAAAQKVTSKLKMKVSLGALDARPIASKNYKGISTKVEESY